MVTNYGLKQINKINEDVTLEKVDITGNICGEFVKVNFAQVYQNKSKADIEAVYIFPIPDTAVITNLQINLGSRTLKTKVENKKIVEKIYSEAILNGDSPLSLEEIEDNVFKLTIGKILRGETVKIQLTYIDELIYENNLLKLIIPSVIKPKFVPDKYSYHDILNEKDRINENDYECYLNILIEPFSNVEIISSSHRIKTQWESPYLGQITFADKLEDFDKDFIILIKEKEEKEASGMIYKYKNNNTDEDMGILYLRLIPELDSYEETKNNNYDFIIDISETMKGEKLEEAKNALHLCLRNLNSGDTFNIIANRNVPVIFSPKGKIPFNNENLKKASKWINELKAMDNAEIFESIKYCLDEKNIEGDSTIIVFTDDEGEQENEIIKYVEENIENNRIFTFGIDSCASNYFINKLAKVGYGTAEFIYPYEKIDDMILRQFKRIKDPQVDITNINWSGMNIKSTYPGTIDYLYNNEPFCIFAKIKGEIQGTVTIEGKVYDNDYKKTINLDNIDLEANANLIQNVWIIKKLEAMEEKLKYSSVSDSNELKKKIIQISRSSNILTHETSFIIMEEIEEPILGMSIRNIVPLSINEETLKNITEAYFIESPNFAYKLLHNQSKTNNYSLTKDYILKLLAKTQSADGSFENIENSPLEEKIKITSSVILAFSIGKNNINLYSKQLVKSVKFLMTSYKLNKNNLNNDLKYLLSLTFSNVLNRGLIKGDFKNELENILKELPNTNDSLFIDLIKTSIEFNDNYTNLYDKIHNYYNENSIYKLALISCLFI